MGLLTQTTGPLFGFRIRTGNSGAVVQFQLPLRIKWIVQVNLETEISKDYFKQINAV